MLLLRRVVAHVDLRPELHFLRFDLALVLASLLGLDGLVVLELAVIHDAAHGRFRVRRDFHEVEPLVVGHPLGFRRHVNTHLFAIEADQTAFANRDLFVEPRLLSSYRAHLPIHRASAP